MEQSEPTLISWKKYHAGARSVNTCYSKAKYYLCVPVLVEYEGHSWHK